MFLRVTVEQTGTQFGKGTQASLFSSPDVYWELAPACQSVLHFLRLLATVEFP